MRPVRRYPTLLALTMWVVILALAAITAQAAPSAPFTLIWDAIGSGGASTGGPYTLVDAVGQPAAGASAGGSFLLADGFVAAGGGGTVVSPSNRVYLPTILR